MIQRDVSRRAPFGNEQLGDTSKQGLFTDINTVIMVAMNSNTSRHAISTVIHTLSYQLLPRPHPYAPLSLSLLFFFVLICLFSWLSWEFLFLGRSRLTGLSVRVLTLGSVARSIFAHHLFRRRVVAYRNSVK